MGSSEREDKNTGLKAISPKFPLYTDPSEYSTSCSSQNPLMEQLESCWVSEKCWLTLIILINLVRKLVIKCCWKNNIFTISIDFCDWHNEKYKYFSFLWVDRHRVRIGMKISYIPFFSCSKVQKEQIDSTK